MGPRPFGRGRRTSPRQAARRPRASMGPRPFGRGRLLWQPSSPASRSTLQWGRDLSVAEGAHGRGRGGCRVVLQWGRDLSVAEGRGHRYDAVDVLGFNGAATFRSRKVSEGQTPKEALAASMGPRPFGRGRAAGALGIPPWPPELQWGRDLSVAEGQCSGGRHGGRCAASMGPRPFGRGRKN